MVGQGLGLGESDQRSMRGLAGKCFEHPVGGQTKELQGPLLLESPGSTVSQMVT